MLIPIGTLTLNFEFHILFCCPCLFIFSRWNACENQLISQRVFFFWLCVCVCVCLLDMDMEGIRQFFVYLFIIYMNINLECIDMRSIDIYLGVFLFFIFLFSMYFTLTPNHLSKIIKKKNLQTCLETCPNTGHVCS